MNLAIRNAWEKSPRVLGGILGENRNNFIWELEHLGRFWESGSQGPPRSQRALFPVGSASGHAHVGSFLLVFPDSLLSDHKFFTWSTSSLQLEFQGVRELGWKISGSLFSDFSLQNIMLFLCEYRQQATIVLAVSVTLSTPKICGHFPITLGWLQVSRKGCLPTPVLQNSDGPLDFVV